MRNSSKSGPGRRFFVRAVLAAVVSGFVFSGSALAERGDRRGGFERFDRFAPPGGNRADDRDAAAREEQRRRRLSPEQRDQIRRDIDEAGRDIYRRPRRFQF